MQDTSVDPAADHAAIVRLVEEVGHSIDRRDFQALAALYTPDAVVTTPGGSASGPVAIAAMARESHARFAATNHRVDDVDVDLHDGTAAVSAHVTVTFTSASDDSQPAESTIRSVRYDYGVSRTDDGWRFVTATITIED